MSKKLSTKPKIVVVVGPTASGKTGLAIQLAKKFNGEVISGDSRQIYRGMDIGTAKPTKKETEEIKHYLIDIKNPNETYTAADFKNDALRAIKKILDRGKLPIIAGGTGLYVKAVVDNLDIPAVKPDPAFRAELEHDISTKGLAAVYEKLVRLDPETAYIVDPYNPRRVIRALEITHATKKPFSEQRRKGEQLWHAMKIGIALPRETLVKKIDDRVHAMMREGLVDEVQNLMRRYGADIPALDAIGYREIIDAIKGKCSMSEATSAIKQNTRQFARRQLTWFRADPEIRWIETLEEAETLVREFLRA